MNPDFISCQTSHLAKTLKLSSISSQPSLPGLLEIAQAHANLDYEIDYEIDYDSVMAQGMFDVECPCCKAVLKVDSETRTVIAHTVPVKPPPIDDLAAEVAKLKGEGSRREQLFQKNFEAEKTHGKVLEKKFDELFKRAKENPDTTKPVRDIDLD